MDIQFEDDGTASFSINMVGSIHRQTYLGVFKVKCILGPLDSIAADKLYRDLLGDNAYMASEDTKNKAFALSQLKYRIVESPPFWKHDVMGGGGVEDTNVLIEVINKAVEVQSKYLDIKNAEADEIEERLTKTIKNKDLTPEDEGEDEDEIEEEEVEI